MELVNELLECFLKFGRAPQLEKHVFHGKIIGDRTAIVLGAGFRARIAVKSHAIAFVNDL